MKTIYDQDGTNYSLKSRKTSVEVLIQVYLELIRNVDEKFNLDKIVQMTVPPLRNIPGNNYHNSRINEFNTKIRELLVAKYQIINSN